MSTALTKAIRRADALAATAYDCGARTKASGVPMDFAPSAPLSGMQGWQQQQAHAERYDLMREWIYSAVNALASEGAGQPPVVARLIGTEAKAKPQGKKLCELQKMPKAIRRKAADTEYEVQQDHPLVDLLEHPNPFQEKWQFVYSFFANLVLTGMAYVVLGYSKRLKKLELYSLPSTWVKPDHEQGLFSRFIVKNPKAVGADPIPLDRSQVGFAMLPNPGDPLASLAPASSQLRTLKIHEHMLNGQEAFFRNGIFPSVIVTMAQGPYQSIKGRPVLSNVQRRMIYHALRQNVMGDMNQGAAFIIDGLIEDMKPFSLTNREMGWDKTEDRIKTRILSAFGVHSFILGEFMPGSQAQAEIIEGRFYKRVNTYLDMLSTLLTNLLGSVEGDERLWIWFEECQASNPERRTSTFLSMRSTGDISQNELRAEMGLPPDEDLNQAVIQSSMMAGVGQVVQFLSSGAVQREQAVAMLEGLGLPSDVAGKIVGEAKKKEDGVKEDKRSMLLNSVGGMTGTIQVLTAVGQGVIDRDAAAGMLSLFLQISREDALAMVPESPPPPEPPPPPETPPLLPESPEPPAGGEEVEEEPEEEEVGEAVEELKMANLLLAKALEDPERQAERILKSVECCGEKFDPSQPRDEEGRWGSGGGGGGSGSYERYRDRIEGTQAEADREVSKCGKAVVKAKAAVKEAEQRQGASQAKVSECQSKLAEVESRIERLKVEQGASKARIAALQAKLKKRKAKDELEEQLERELQTLEQITDGFRKAIEDLEQVIEMAEVI